jgi:hypothetical protein
MEGKKVPTVEIEIGKGEDVKKVSLYQWLTQEEEDKYNSIMLGDIELDATQLANAQKGEMNMKVSLARVADSNKYLMQCMTVNPWEEVNNWKPSMRTELLNKIQEIREKN